MVSPMLRNKFNGHKPMKIATGTFHSIIWNCQFSFLQSVISNYSPFPMLFAYAFGMADNLSFYRAISAKYLSR